MRKILAGFGLLALLMLPLLAPVGAHAQVPDPSTFATQTASTTDTGAAYVTNMVFNGGLLKFIFYISVIAILIWFVRKGIRSVV